MKDRARCGRGGKNSGQKSLLFLDKLHLDESGGGWEGTGRSEKECSNSSRAPWEKCCNVRCALSLLVASLVVCSAGAPDADFSLRRGRGIGTKIFQPLSIRAFEGDNIGDGETYGDQYEGGLLRDSPGGDVYAWGLNDVGQLGDGTYEDTFIPVLCPVLRGKNITWLSAGSSHVIAINEDGIVFSWGSNSRGQLGLSDAPLSKCSDVSVQSNCDGDRPDQSPYPTSIVDLYGDRVLMTSSRGNSNLAVTKRVLTYGWGENELGQIGSGDKTDRNIPAQMATAVQLRFVLVAMGGEHAMGLTALGEVYAWGSNSYGQLGQDTLGLGPAAGAPMQSDTPLLVPGLQGKMVVKIAAGWSHCMALTESGEVWVWGRNDFGQLGLGDKIERHGPVHLQTSTGQGAEMGFVTAIAAGRSHSIWLGADGAPYTAGRNDAGQLGVGDSIGRTVISKVIIEDRIWCDTPFGSDISPTFEDYVCVGSKRRQPCGLRCKNTLLRLDCGPSNVTEGYTTEDCEPLMPISQKIIKVQAGEYHSYAISEDYNLYSWGSNTQGQIGVGDPSLWGRFIAKPQLVVSLYGKNVSAVAGGKEFTVAKAYREPLHIYTLSPPAGAVSGGTKLYIIGQGYNTFASTNLTCKMTLWKNGTHTSQYASDLIDPVLEVIIMPAIKFSNVRLQCVTPDVRFKLADGETIDSEKMSEYGETLLSPRNLTVHLDGRILDTVSPLVFQYTGLPGITGIIPEGGPVTGDTYVLIQGYNLDKALASDVRVRFGDNGNNWMRGCILTSNLIVTLAPPTGPSNSGIGLGVPYDGACNDLCPDGFDLGCSCSSKTDLSPSCIRGIVRASVDPDGQASRRDRCTDCAYVEGPVVVRVALNGADYSLDSVTYTYFSSPTLQHVAPPPWISQTHWRERQDLMYGGPTTGGTTVDVFGVGLEPAALGRAVCSFGCNYTNMANGLGPKCTPGSARHSLPLPGMFTDANTFVFDDPAPNSVWDLIHFGTWFRCAGQYDRSGCSTYSQATGTIVVSPGYEPVYAPTFRGYNVTTTVVTSCIEDCESRIEFVAGGLLRCTAPARELEDGVMNQTVTVRVKLNGQDIFPVCYDHPCTDFDDGVLSYTYYRQPVVETLAPNGGPLMDRSFIFVRGSGFKNFGWYPQCLFGRQTAVHLRNSTIYAGWVTDKFQTNTSAYIVNDHLLVCYAPEMPPQAPVLLDQEAGRTVHPQVLGAIFSGADGVLETIADNMIVAGGYGRDDVVVSAFSVTLNSQDWIDSPGAPFPNQQPPGTLLEPTNVAFTYYPHPVLINSVPLGGPDAGRTQIVIKGVGFDAFNEMGRWRGQFDSLTETYGCGVNGTCNRPFWSYGTTNRNWFNDTTSSPRPPYVESEMPGWPNGDRNVANQYPTSTTTSIKCRFGDASIPGNRTVVEDPFWGILDRSEPFYVKTVYADYLDNETLRCTTPGDTPGQYSLEVSLNAREYSSQGVLPFTYYFPPETHKLKPSGGPIEGGSTITVTALGLSRYEETPLCRFGSESRYDATLDLFVARDNVTSVATIINDTQLTCKTPFRYRQLNTPFSLSVNGQDFNFEQAKCDVYNPGQTMWDDPFDPKEIVGAKVNYTHPFTGEPLVSTCPFVYYKHPVVWALEPAGGPIEGKSNVRVFGRGYSIFSEDTRCKFGNNNVAWVQAHDRSLGEMGRDDEVLCFTPPRLMLSIRGPDVACTFACIAFPDDPQRCDFKSCSIWHPSKMQALKLAIAEVVGTRDILGDIDVFPSDVVIETVKQPRDPYSLTKAPSVDVVFCVRCVTHQVTDQAVGDAIKIVEATRKGVLQAWMSEYGSKRVDFMEISAEPAPVAIALNGQDYTYDANALFTFYMAPTIFGLAPAGGPLVRYDIADTAHKDPTRVEIGGIGMQNYDEEAQCRFGNLVVTASVIGDTLMLCDTPWPGVLFREGTCDVDSGGGCILDVWVEISLNGFDFTRDSQVNYRYYLQPSFPTFSPMGGPTDGGTLVTFFGKGFNRFNDGSLRIQWGLSRIFPEEDMGALATKDDFDPTPAEVEPLEDEYGVLTSAQIIALNGSESNIIAPNYETARDLILNSYRFDTNQWDYSASVSSNAQCGAMDLPGTMAKIDVGYLPGNFSTTRDDITSRSLYFTGQSAGVLAGRLVISRPVDMSRGGSVQFWVKRGSARAPLACEQPDVRDELSLSLKPEEGTVYLKASCMQNQICDGRASLSFAICNVSESYTISKPNAVVQNRSKDYIMANKVVRTSSYLTPRCLQGHTWASNASARAAWLISDSTDQTHFRVSLTYLAHGPGSAPVEARLLVPIDRVLNPMPGTNETFLFQTCSCVAVTTCPIPPCDDSCSCRVVDNANCSLDGITSSVARPFVGKKRTVLCSLPKGTVQKRYVVLLTIEYSPDSTPPTWNQMQRWRRMRVYDTRDYAGFSLTSQQLYQNQRGVRDRVNSNELTRSQASNAMVRCPRNQACYNLKSRLMVRQNVHGQGDFDAWAMDDFRAHSKGGIVDDTRIHARSPAAKHAIPLSETEDTTWRKDGKLTGQWTRGIDILIGMNNQSYELAGRLNFCRFVGDEKTTDLLETITCDQQYFNWDEPQWLFGTSVRPTYTNWLDKTAKTNWMDDPKFLQVTSQQFRYYQQPTVTGLAPSGGPIIGGTGVTVIGSGFTVFSDPLRTPKCKFGEYIVEARVDSDTNIYCTTPDTLQPGYVSVAVSLNEIDFTKPSMGRQYSIPFLYYNPPQVQRLFPSSGPSRGGTTVFVIGVGFLQLPSAPACRFIGINDPTVVMDVPGKFMNDTLIECVAPAIADLCTPRHFCEAAITTDPNWRGCLPWKTCPFNDQCGEVACGCPTGPRCQQQDLDGSKVKRNQIGEDVLYDVEVQVSLNGICCERDQKGRIADGCIRCTDPNQRCGCIGDFTTVQVDQDSTVFNTYTYYREAELDYDAIMQSGRPPCPETGECHAPYVEPTRGEEFSISNGATDPIRLFGKYLRNMTDLQCVFSAKCHQINECDPPPLEAIPNIYGSYFFLDPSRVFCRAPEFWGQGWEQQGRAQLFVSVNGIDTTNFCTTDDGFLCEGNGDCPTIGCLFFQYSTPMSPGKVRAIVLGVTISLTVTIMYIAIQRQRYLKKNAKYVADTGGEWEKPSLREAKSWQNEHQVRKYGTTLFPLWKTGSAELGQLGVGMGLYFEYLKYMLRYFTVMSAMAIPSMALCYAGNAFKTFATADSTVRMSLGNIGLGWDSTMEVICFETGCTNGLVVQTREASFVLAIADCAITLVFIFATWKLKVFQEKAIIAIDEDTITASDYSILVEGIPKDATDPDEIRAFFSRYGEVADVAIGLNNGRLIDLFQKRGVLEIKVEEMVAKLKLFKLQTIQQTLKKMRKKQQKLDAKILALRQKTDFKAVVAYVTFNEESGQEECLESYSFGTFQKLLGRDKGKVKTFRGRYNLRVTQAPEPSNVLWENLQVRGFQVYIRAGIANLIAVSMLLVSFAIVIGVKAVQESLQVAGGQLVCLQGPNPEALDVQEQIVWAKYTQATSASGTALYQTYLECYCGPAFGNKADKEAEFCADYFTNQRVLTMLAVGSVGVVIAINQILQLVLKALAGTLEKPHTISGWEKNIAQRIFLAQWVNTGLLITIVNGDWNFLIPALRGTFFGSVFTGTYKDFEEGWYLVVGAALVRQVATASVSPNVAVLAQWPLGVAKQYALKNRELTQRKLNTLFEGAEFLLSKRYGALLNILFVIMTYSSALPVLYTFGILFFATAYWCDKIAVLRAMKRPAQYDEKLAVFSTLCMSWSILFHLMISIWFYAYVDGDVLVSLQWVLDLVFRERFITKRLAKKPAFVVFCTLLAFIVFEILGRTVGPTLVKQLISAIRGTVEEVKEGNPSFFEALENQEIAGLDTYNIKKNPRYRDAFQSDIQADAVESDSEEEDDDFGDDDD